MRYLIILPYIRAINESLETITLALESINTFFMEDHEIIVAGERPDFVKDYPNVRWIYKPDETKETNVNIVSQLYYMLKNYGQDYDCFIYWQDDIVAVNNFSIEDLCRTLAVDEEVITNRYTTNYYIRDCEYTAKKLLAEGYEPYSTRTHAPILFDKDDFIEMVDKYDMCHVPHDYIMMYLVQHEGEPTFIDPKENRWVTMVSGSHVPDLDLPLWICFTNAFDNKDIYNIVEQRIREWS